VKNFPFKVPGRHAYRVGTHVIVIPRERVRVGSPLFPEGKKGAGTMLIPGTSTPTLLFVEKAREGLRDKLEGDQQGFCLLPARREGMLWSSYLSGIPTFRGHPTADKLAQLAILFGRCLYWREPRLSEASEYTYLTYEAVSEYLVLTADLKSRE